MAVGALRYIVRAVVVVCLLAGLLAGSAYWFDVRVLNGAGPHDQDKFIIVDRGDGHATIRWTLKRAGVISDLYIYDAARIWQGTTFQPKAGEYLIPAGSTIIQTMAIIDQGRSYQRRITIVEGLRSDEIKAFVNKDGHLTGTIDDLPIEGSLLPETYFYTHGTTRQDLLARMRENQEMLLIEGWSARDPDIAIKTRDEAIILASIVEMESSRGEERRLVAGVFMNRLKAGMRLQSDPTVLYGIASSPKRPITKEDLKRKTKWNTYQMRGLPETPICNPGEDAIMAVLQPAKIDYMYFVSDAKGGLLFAKTLDEHNRNVRQFRKAIKASQNDG